MIKAYLFTLPTCAPCKVFKEMIEQPEEQRWLRNKGVSVQIIDMSKTDDETLRLQTEFVVRSAPTMVMLTSLDDKSAQKNFKMFKNYMEFRECLKCL
jgi:hypothetical protein